MSISSITTSVSSGSNFLSEIWAREALAVLRNQLVLCKTIATDADFGQFTQGHVLHLGYPGEFAAQLKTEGNAVTAQAPTNQLSVNVTLNQHATVDIVVEDVAKVQSSQNLMTVYAESAAKALAKQVESYLFGLMSSSTLSTIGSLGGGLTEALIRNARTQLSKALAPMTDRYLMLSPEGVSGALGDTNLNRWFAINQQDVVTGELAKIYGFSVRENTYIDAVSPAVNDVQTISITGTPTGGSFTVSFGGSTSGAIAYNATASTVQTALNAMSSIGASGVTVTGGPGPGTAWVVTFTGTQFQGAKQAVMTTTDSLTGGSSPASAVAHTTSGGSVNLAYHKNAMILATRSLPAPDPGAGADSAIAMDDVSGLALRVVRQYRADYRGHWIGWDILYGASALRTDQMVQIQI